MSWTEDRDLAQWFHERNWTYAVWVGSKAMLLGGVVEPDGVLAIFEDQRAGMPGMDHHAPAETEVVIDPAYLRRPVERLRRLGGSSGGSFAYRLGFPLPGGTSPI